MKKYSFLFLAVLVLIFARCTKDDNKEYYSVLGNVKITNDSIIIVDDQDTRYLVNDPPSSFISSIDNNDRLIVYFSFSKAANPAGIDHVIDVYDAVKVLYKPLVVLTESNADSIANDPVNVVNLWVAKNFFNLNFEFYGSNSVTHYINLIRKPGDISGADTVDVEIRHNNRGDIYNYVNNGFVTFDLSSLRGEPGDSVILHVKAKEYDNHTFDKYVSYKF